MSKGKVQRGVVCAEHSLEETSRCPGFQFQFFCEFYNFLEGIGEFESFSFE